MNWPVHRTSYFLPSEETTSLFSNRPDHFSGAVLGLPVELRSALFCANRILPGLPGSLLLVESVASLACALKPPNGFAPRSLPTTAASHSSKTLDARIFGRNELRISYVPAMILLLWTFCHAALTPSSFEAIAKLSRFLHRREWADREIEALAVGTTRKGIRANNGVAAAEQ